MGQAFKFAGKLFLAAAESPWVFVALPTEVSDEISDIVPRRPGFGSVRVAVRIGGTEWTTSLFPSKEFGTYVLPVKRAVREAERIEAGDNADMTIRVLPE